jgi:CO/xanthine dehydrogenase FAD-binding subunit
VTTQEYFLPRTVDEAVGLLADHGPSLLVIAGGTLAMPLINEGVSMPEAVMGLRRAGLNGIQHSNGSLALGATVTLSQVIADKTIPLLQEAARHVGGWSIRNMATVGGNLFAPPPSGDFAVALLALDAQVRLVSKRGQRVVPLAEFYTGFMANALRPDELVAEILVPVPKGKTVYLKYGRRHANTPAIVTVAARISLSNKKVKDARLALNAVGPHPIRAEAAEKALIGATFDQAAIAQAAQAAAQECEPFTDSVATEWYRRKMVNVYVRRALTELAG